MWPLKCSLSKVILLQLYRLLVLIVKKRPHYRQVLKILFTVHFSQVFQTKPDTVHAAFHIPHILHILHIRARWFLWSPYSIFHILHIQYSPYIQYSLHSLFFSIFPILHIPYSPYPIFFIFHILHFPYSSFSIFLTSRRHSIFSMLPVPTPDSDCEPDKEEKVKAPWSWLCKNVENLFFFGIKTSTPQSEKKWALGAQFPPFFLDQNSEKYSKSV